MGYKVIERIELENFMSHRHTVIEPARGLTVLIGPNNCGKSAVVAALQILSHNDNSTYVLRHETGKCRVSVTTDEGDAIVWRRGKNGGPAYEVNGNTFDRLKSAGQPEILDSTLRLPKVQCDRDEVDIHFGEQKSPVFLVRDSARTAADFFASSSDAGRMMKMQSLHKQKVRDAKRELKADSSKRDELTQQLQLLEPVSDLEKNYQQCCQLGTEMQGLQGAITELQSLMVQGNQMTIEHRQLELKQECLRELDPVPVLQPADQLERVVTDLGRLNTVVSGLQQEYECLVSLEEPPRLESCSELAVLVQQLDHSISVTQRYSRVTELLASVEAPPELQSSTELQELWTEMLQRNNESDELQKKYSKMTDQLADTEAEILDWARRNPSCPTCGNSIDSDGLLAHVQHLKSGMADG